MKKNDEEYKKLRDQFINEQLKIADPKPVGMMGHWAWYYKTIKQFDNKMIESGKLEK